MGRLGGMLKGCCLGWISAESSLDRLRGDTLVEKYLSETPNRRMVRSSHSPCQHRSNVDELSFCQKIIGKGLGRYR